MTEWIGKLGALNQHRDVPYVKKGDGKEVCCLLCGTGWMPPSSRKAHFNGSTHASNYSRVQAAERRQKENELTLDRIQKMKEIELRIHRLGLRKWQNSMKSLMYEYTVHGAGDGVGVDEYDGVLNKLKKYERMECVSLLELAIWKASICDGLVFASMVELRQYKVLEEDFDSTAYSKKRLVESGSHFIIPRVLEYL
jgi:hypothetical protein